MRYRIDYETCVKTKLNFGTGTSRTVRVSGKIGLRMELTAGASQKYFWKACAVGVIAYNPNTFHTDLGRIIISKNRPNCFWYNFFYEVIHRS